MLIFYVRHGDPVYNPDGLTKRGELQAQAVAKRLYMYGIDEVYTSSSNRAKLTAQPLLDLMNGTATECDWMHEQYVGRDFGGFLDDERWTWCYNVPKIKKLFNSDEVLSYGNKWYDAECLQGIKGTSFKSGMQRVNTELDNFLKNLGYEHDRQNRVYKAVAPNEKRIAIFAHGGFGMAFMSSILDIPYPMLAIRMREHDTTNFSVIDFSGTGDVIPKLLQYSNDSHIYRENLLMTAQKDKKF